MARRRQTDRDTLDGMMADATTYPVKVIARLLMIDERRVQQLAQEGVIPKAARGRYDLVQSVQGYIRYMQERARVSPQEGSGSYTEERTRHEAAKAALAELDLALRRGEVLPVADSEAAVIALASAVRTRILAIPSKVAPLAYAAESAHEAEAIVREHITEALQELADAAAAVPAPDEPAESGARRERGGGATTAASSHGKRVGGRRKKAQRRSKR